ncbi:MAG: LuxR family transcriptional regulator [Spirochaetaceae bacterium]|nr:MAG: LuxR family transcriptional regulator [Spirochaetaceae bacterium]
MTSCTPEEELSALRHLLAEREKELDALYRLAALFTRPAGDVTSLLQQTADELRRSMQLSEIATVRVTADGHDSAVSPGTADGEAGDGTVVDRYDVTKRHSIEREVRIEVTLAGAVDARPARVLDREKRLIESTVFLLADVLEHRDIDQALRESTRILQLQTAELEQKNSALREILSQLETQKEELLHDSRSYLEMFVQPYLYQLQRSSALSEHDRFCVAQMSQALQRMGGEGASGIRALAGSLSPREVEVCGLIRNGLSTKEISGFLGISPATVERHRNTIRSKLGLTGSGTSLTGYLRSLA